MSGYHYPPEEEPKHPLTSSETTVVDTVGGNDSMAVRFSYNSTFHSSSVKDSLRLELQPYRMMYNGMVVRVGVPKVIEARDVDDLNLPDDLKALIADTVAGLQKFINNRGF